MTDNIVLAMPGGWMKMLVEIMLLLHLITAFPIITNPPAQFFEEMLNVPSSEDVLALSFPNFLLGFEPPLLLYTNGYLVHAVFDKCMET